MILFYGIWGALRESSDQCSFFKTSRLIIQRQNPFASSIKYIREAKPNITLDGLDAAGGRSLYPPSAHIMFIPFYAFLLSQEAGKVSWLICNLFFLAIIYYAFSARYLRKNPAMHKYIFFCLIIGAASTKTNLSLGQTGLFSLAAFLLSISLANPFFSGLAFSFAACKPSLMFLFSLYMLFNRRLRSVLMALLVHGLITMIVAAWLSTTPIQLIKDYVAKVAVLTSYETGVSFYFQTNGATPKAILFLVNLPLEIIYLLTISLYIFAILWIYKNRFAHEAGLLGLIAIMTVLVDYHQHYDFIVLFFIFPVMAHQMDNESRSSWPFYYYLLLMYSPNLSRCNLFFFDTGKFFIANPDLLLCWQIFYTLLFSLLLWIYSRRFLSPTLPYHNYYTSS